MTDEKNKLVVFQDKKIRRVLYNGEWYFSVIDTISALTDSTNPRNYWNMIKAREAENGIELYTICVQLKLPSSDGKFYETDCANTKSIFRIIQSIPSKKAEPFKLWLAKVGYERVQEIENPELAQERMKLLYEQKGYSKDHMDDLELIFTMLGEKLTTEITQKEDAKMFEECKDASMRGGKVAGKARQDAEQELGRSIVSGDNYIDAPEKMKRKFLSKQ